MRYKALATYVAIAIASISTPALAATTITFNEGTGGLSPGEVSFASFDGADTGSPAGSGFIVQTGSNSNGADPAVGATGDPYFSVLGGGDAAFNFGANLLSFGLDYGSADTYNLFTLFFSDGGSESYTGQDIINSGTANGDQGAPRTNGRLTFTADPGRWITGFGLSSGQNSAEIDNIGVLAAVPEPGTWMMMLFGFMGVGFAARRRKVSSGFLQAA